MNPYQNLDLYLVDNDADLLRALGPVFLSRGYPVQAFRSGEAFLASTRLQQPGCVLLDLRMGEGMSGLQVFDELRRRESPLVVVFMSGHGTVTDAVGAVHNGAFDWIEKPCTNETLLEKVGRAFDKAAGVAARSGVKQQGLQLWGRLTEREAQVAHEVRKGSANKLTARKLVIDVRTVQSHRARVYAKLDVSGAAALDQFMRDIDL